MSQHIHIGVKTKDFRGGPELKVEVRKALSTANRLLASASSGEEKTIRSYNMAELKTRHTLSLHEAVTLALSSVEMRAKNILHNIFYIGNNIFSSFIIFHIWN